MAEVDDDKEITMQESEEHPIEISTIGCENQDAQNKKEAGDLTINEETFKNEATEEMMLMEMQQEEVNSGKVTVEEQVTAGNENVQLTDKGGLDLATRNENEESKQNISAETAKELEESLLEAVDSTDVKLKGEQSEQNPYAEELSNENKSVEDDQNQLRESEGQRCREEIEEITAMKDIGVCAASESTIVENVQESKDSQAGCVVDKERSEGSGSTEESQISEGLADTLVNIAAEPDFKEDADNTNETPVSVNNGDKPEECCTNAELIAEQMELYAHTVTDNGSMMAITIASHSNDKSHQGDTLLKERDEAEEMCHDQDPSDVETGPVALAETPQTGLKASTENIEAGLEIQTKDDEKILESVAKGSEDNVDIPPVHARPCLGNVTECLEDSKENQDICLETLAERTCEVPVSRGDNPAERLETEDTEEQPNTNDAEPCQDVQVIKTMESTEEESNQGNLIETMQAMGSPTRAHGESTEVSNTSPEQLCETGISGSEDQAVPELMAPEDNQIIVAGEQ